MAEQFIKLGQERDCFCQHVGTMIKKGGEKDGGINKLKPRIETIE